jgi:hypothetical protein
MQPRFTPVARYALTFAFVALLTFVFSLTVNAQYFKLSGSFTYANIPFRPGNQVFDISPDAKMGIALRNDFNNVHSAVITTFHPLFGDQFDTKTFGFGPLEVRLAKVGNNLRAVVLTSQGGPRRIYLFDVSESGQLTEIGFTDLTDSNADAGSNIVLSGAAAVGWTAVHRDGGFELVCFSLTNGAIVKRFTLAGGLESLVFNEGPGRRVIAYRTGSNLKIVNVLDPANPAETASVPLVRNDEFSAMPTDEIAFSADGRYAFVANQFHNFAAIDLNTKQVVATLDSSFRFFRIESFEDSQRRLLAVLSASTGTVNSSALLLIDATNPSQLTILKNISPAPVERFKFSNDGSRLFAASATRLVAFNLPDFTTIWEQATSDNPIRSNGLHIYGPDNEIFGAWWFHDGTGNGALLGAFPAAGVPNVSLSDSVTVNETVGGVNANFTVTLSAPTTHRVTINYATVDGTAEQGSDYTATSGALVLQPGATSGNVAVPILDDLLDETNETLTFRVTPNLGNISDAESTVTINDNDEPPSISITAGPGATEGDGFPGSLVSFLIKLSAPSGQDVTVSYATSPFTASANDFFGASGTFTMFAGQTEQEIVVPVLPDRLSEGDEFFFVNLTGVANATIEHGKASGIIIDDDPPVLALEQNSQRGIALDAVTFVREPFTFSNPNYFGTDQRTRIAFFSTNLILTPGLLVTAQAVDAQQVVHQLPVEFVGNVPGFVPVMPQAPVLTQIIVQLPPTITTAGDLQVRIITRGRSSNAVLVGVKP